MEKPARRVKDSLTEQVQIVQQTHMNGYHRLFGGQLIAWMDVVAGVVGRRHSGMMVTTAAIDNLQFLAPAYVDDMIVITGRVTYVGHTSMEVRLDAEIEARDGSRTPLNRAYFVMVALDELERPAEAPKLILETEEEKREWEAARARVEARKARR
ncbi:MAG: acyl-CoA thioesterase [Peptococcaceae bacterium]|nr:acyl-CoA thioesterase [Peptococcaceae bacterium]